MLFQEGDRRERKRANNDSDRQLMLRGGNTRFLSTHTLNNSTYIFFVALARPPKYQRLPFGFFQLENNKSFQESLNASRCLGFSQMLTKRQCPLCLSAAPRLKTGKFKSKTSRRDINILIPNKGS